MLYCVPQYCTETVTLPMQTVCTQMSNVKYQQALVMRPLQVDRWRITIRNDNNVVMHAVAVDTVKQKCFQAAFEHFGQARCGLQVCRQPMIPSSRSSDWKSPVAKSTVGARNNECSGRSNRRAVWPVGTLPAAVSMSAVYAGARPMDDLWTSKHNL